MNIRVIGKEGIFLKLVKNNIVVYVVLLTIFAGGLLFGSLFYKNVGNESQMSIYLRETISELKDKNNADSYAILKGSLVKNIIIAIVSWVLGASVVGVPILLIYLAYKGFTLGFTISSIIVAFGFWQGNLISFAMLFFQNLLLLFAIIVAIGSGIKLCTNTFLKKKGYKD